jgi:hypothetical protein
MREDDGTATHDEDPLVAEALENVTRVPGLRALLRGIRRFIDFDGTIVDDQRRPRSHLCQVPIGEFFAQAPYVIATWNRPAAEAYFAKYVELARPVCIIAPPMLYLEERCDVAKDFEALGVTDALIVDDFGPKGLIHAPGCRVIGPDEPL